MMFHTDALSLPALRTKQPHPGLFPGHDAARITNCCKDIACASTAQIATLDYVGTVIRT